MDNVFRMKGSDSGSASDPFVRRVNGEITTREYLKSISDRVSQRRKSEEKRDRDRREEEPA